MSLSIGQRIWVPCEVKPGPFPHERMVRVNSPALSSAVSSWIGFVPTGQLREPIEHGSTYMTGIVINVLDDRFLAQLIGDGLANSVFEDAISRAVPVDSFKG